MTDQKQVNLTIDGKPAQVPAGTLLWEAARTVHSDIPIFCYHSKLGPVGVCRMCLVEVGLPARDGNGVQWMPKPQTSCTTEVSEGMVVHTRSPEVEKAQRGILEFLLINHPLDCPICDRGGECPLQDQTFQYGPGVSRFIERKRHYLKPIELGPTIDLDRERCILCWRCVRFTSEIAGDNQLILVDRGSETFIGTYEGLPYESNFSGNVIELCPVGALTSRKQRFTFRPWELKQHSSICPNCPMGCNIYIDVRDAQEVTRFRSRANDEVDDGWLCDRGRFGYDFIGTPERLKTPLIREDGELRPASWSRAYRVIAENLLRTIAESGAGSIAAIASPQLSNEELYTFKLFMTKVVGTGAIDFSPRPILPAEANGSRQILDAKLGPIRSIDSASVIIIAATDPAQREPVMDLRIRKAVNKLNAKLVEIGSNDIPLTPLADASLRCNPDQIAGILRALTMADVNPPDFPQVADARTLIDGSGSVVILYEDALPDVPTDAKADLLSALASLVTSLGDARSVTVLPMLQSTNEMAARDFGLLPSGPDGSDWSASVVQDLSKFKAAVVAGADIAFEAKNLRNLDFLAVTALELNETARQADVVLPAASFAEQVGTFTNSSRRVQVFSAAVPSPGIARPVWQIFVELSQRFDNPLTFASPDTILAEIAANVPGYRERVPSSYVELTPQGVSTSGGAEAAAE